MTRQLTYKFEELPLLIVDGFEAGLVNGEALLNYWPNGVWSISEIYLDGYRRRSAAEITKAMQAGGTGIKSFDEKPVLLERGTDIHTTINNRLAIEWASYVQDHVNAAIDDDADAAPERRMEMV